MAHTTFVMPDIHHRHAAVILSYRRNRKTKTYFQDSVGGNVLDSARAKYQPVTFNVKIGLAVGHGENGGCIPHAIRIDALVFLVVIRRGVVVPKLKLAKQRLSLRPIVGRHLLILLGENGIAPQT
jgi:hypothetical protein